MYRLASKAYTNETTPALLVFCLADSSGLDDPYGSVTVKLDLSSYGGVCGTLQPCGLTLEES